METVKRVGLYTNVFIGIFLEEKEKAEPSLAILKLISDAVVLSAATELSSDAFLTYDDDFAKVRKIRCKKTEDYLKKLKEKR